MSTLYIAEFKAIGKSSGSSLQAPLEPPLSEQTVTFTTSSVQGSALNHATRLVRIHVDADSHFAVGSSPTATTSNRKMIAGQTEYLAIPQGSSLNIAVIEA